ncbi:ShET2/EspL2 family type III secretion system effector toxin [Endozoicomonas sp. GU-1]|uniref:ShET2/EspL2 family type III secretion system effector toxin n=1 Tax=Endozoicomonas sp. GU-1 TaxID=3009078 RepID=UPI0022B33A66|nr:ShET2/EspL2 family type III secretion system effector toxin [Endozoicomonas sp. GU-1]WBA80080.1 ShET2/EspL2 family type III secretion system effector toxin [Endozoicomonas sp. GU-1]
MQAIKSVVPKKILEEKKSKPANVFQHTSLISRKIEQLNHQGRTYLLQVDKPLSGNTPKESLTDALPVNTTGVLQYVSKGDLRRFNRKANNLFDHKPIACRHLAYAFATGKFGTKDVGKFTSIDQLDKISRHSGIKTDQALQDTTVDGHKTAQEGYYFDRDGVGKAIYVACQQQLADGEQNKTYLFSSSNHLMALKINWSPERSEIKLDFYDPNDTLRVRRLIVPDLQTLKAIKIEHLVPDSDFIKLYYPKPYLGGCLTTTTVESRAGSSLVRVLADMNPSILFLMLTNGHFSSKMVVQFLGQLNRLDPYHQKIALMAKSFKGFPGLYAALENGHGECVKGYLSLVMASPLSDEFKQHLLMAKSPDGFPGLFTALANGHGECVKGYLSLVMASPLSDEFKQHLLMAKSPDGFPGLFLALQNGHWECVKSYVDLVMASPFSDEFKQDLLMAKSPDGFPGLFLALLDNGLVECVKGYLSLVMASPLSDEVKLNLLMAKSADGYPGLFAALENGSDECVKGYLSLVKASPFSDKVKHHLLMAARGDSISGLCVTLENGKRECLRTYVIQVINSSLSDVSKQFDD